MIDTILEDAARDDFAGVIDGLIEDTLSEIRAALHDLVDILELEMEIGEGMPIASNTFPPTEVWQ